MYCLSSYPEDGGNIFFQNVGKCPSDYTVIILKTIAVTENTPQFVFVGLELASDDNVLLARQ